MIIASGVAALPTMVTKKEEAINKVAYQADLVSKKRLVKRKIEAAQRRAAMADGKRSPNSLSPRIFMLAAWAQKNRGGLWKKGLSFSKAKVKSLFASISRVTSL